jgi:drug/metabolite transporter (DMT)-like permease
MSPLALGLILAAAVAHASWNLFSKQASVTGAVFFVWLLAAAAACLYAPVVAITVIMTHPHLTAMNWIFMAGTGVLEAGYFLFLQFGYSRGDLSLVYPIGRGTGALLAAVAGILILGERPGPLALAGIGCIVAGIVAIGIPARAGMPARGQPDRLGPPDVQGQGSPAPLMAAGLALCTGVFIAGYTIWDKYAVTTLRTPPLLQGYASFPFMLAAFMPLVLRDTGRLRQVARDYWRQVLAAGLLAPLAYVLVLIALSFTAVSSIAPAREVSILFGVLLGRRLLGEGGAVRRLAAAAAIVAGIVAVAFG